MIVQFIKNDNNKDTSKVIKYTLIARNNEISNVILNPQNNDYDGYLQSNQVVYFFKNIYPIKSFHFYKGNQVSGKLITNNTSNKTIEPIIYDSKGNEIGKATLSTYGKHFSMGTPCLYFNYNGITYTNYLIGMGKKGVYFCLYNDHNHLLAIASKPKNIKGSNCSYTLYVKKDEFTIVALLSTIILHVMKYEVTSRKISYFTPQQIIKEKYNSNFIEEVIKQEGVDNLPENMPLVKEILKKNKRKKNLSYLIFILIVLIIIALIILL